MVDADNVPHITSGCAQPLNVDIIPHMIGSLNSALKTFPKSGSTGGIPSLQEGNSAVNMSVDATGSFDVPTLGCDDARTDGPNTEFTSVAHSPSESLIVSVQIDVEAKKSAITWNMTHSTLSNSVTLPDKMQNVFFVSN
jgi:hypothetical protein